LELHSNDIKLLLDFLVEFCDSVYFSKSSNSIYINYNGIKIRLSDHDKIGNDEDIGYDINIKNKSLKEIEDEIYTILSKVI